MSRSLVLGNGSILVGIDSYARIRDFYFDYVGLENHMGENSLNKIGVFVDEKISWLDSGEWEIIIDYKPETLAGSITAINESLELELYFLDVVYNEKNIFLREITVKNLAKRARNIKVFLNHQFRMYGIEKKDTVYFDPEDEVIIHYKGRRVSLIGGVMDDKNGFSDYSVGLSGIEGREGTWMDAEDGSLQKNEIEHGSVDSTIAFEKSADSNASFSFIVWVAFAKTLDNVKKINLYILKKTPEHLLESAQDFWYAWLNKTNFDFCDLDKEIVDLFKKSLLIMRTHVDNTGAIIASGDSELLRYGRDNYSYVWTRDAAQVALALDMAGYHEVSRKFFEFANEVISEEGYFFHRYRCDKSLGSSWHPWISDGRRQLPIQEDETALVIYALWKHYENTKNLEFIESIYNSLIKKASNFMLGFRNELKLPFPSYDLWEMKYGINTFTSSSVYAALTAASEFAKLLGKENDEKLFRQGADELKEAITKNLYNDNARYFYKLIDIVEGNIIHDETVDSSSLHGISFFEVLPINDSKLEEAYKVFNSHLSCSSGVGGIARFENDEYFKDPNTSCPGNPWFITTLWKAQYEIKKAQSNKNLNEAKNILKWVTNKALFSGILSEQIHWANGNQLSASPLVWSHAEFVITVIMYINKYDEA